jgi:hypothetical protein
MLLDINLTLGLQFEIMSKGVLGDSKAQIFPWRKCQRGEQ